MNQTKALVFRIVCLAVFMVVPVLASCGSGTKETLSETVSGEIPADDGTVSQGEAYPETKIEEGVDGEKKPSVTEVPPKSGITEIDPDFYTTMDNHFGFNPAFLDYAAAAEAGGCWDRPHFELFSRGLIEPEPGRYYFLETDRLIQEAQRNGFHVLANIQPRSLRDESECYETVLLPEPGMPVPFTEARKPCDMEAYKRFVSALVERYDGDGINDMPGLTMPIKHWEIMNEPEFPMYFLGTPADYVAIVQVSAAAIKAADPDALVVQGGMAGMSREMTEFWQQVFDLGVAEYFDVFNMHSIGHGEHLNIPAFTEFLTRNGVSGKPVWVTEVQYQQSREAEDSTPGEFAAIMARSYLFALANGVDKLFYVNLQMPFEPMKETKEPLPGDTAGGPPFDERSALIDNDGLETPLYYAHRTISEKLGKLDEDDEIIILKEETGDWHIEAGQYMFTVDGATVFVLWGAGPLPVEIQGTVTVTEISGESRIIDANEIILDGTPIFVEPVE